MPVLDLLIRKVGFDQFIKDSKKRNLSMRLRKLKKSILSKSA